MIFLIPILAPASESTPFVFYIAKLGELVITRIRMNSIESVCLSVNIFHVLRTRFVRRLIKEIIS